MYTLPNFPLKNQLSQPTVDGQSDENARLNCVPTSIAAGLQALTGKTFDGDQLKDAVYGQGATGTEAAANYVNFCKSQGVALVPFSGSQQALVSKIHEEISAGNPVVLTMPSQWGTAPADPVHPAGYTHVGIAAGQDVGVIRVMNPWGGFWQDQSDAWWQARLCYGQVWVMSKEQTMSGVPAGWHDDGHLLTAPNGVQVDLGFRDYVLNNNWDPNNWPLEHESGVDPVEQSNPALGAGTHLPFRWSLLEWTAARGVFAAWIGQEYLWYRSALAAANQKLSDLQSQLDAANQKVQSLSDEVNQLKSQPTITPAQQADVDAVAALKKALGL